MEEKVYFNYNGDYITSNKVIIQQKYYDIGNISHIVMKNYPPSTGGHMFAGIALIIVGLLFVSVGIGYIVDKGLDNFLTIIAAFMGFFMLVGSVFIFKQIPKINPKYGCLIYRRNDLIGIIYSYDPSYIEGLTIALNQAINDFRNR